MYARVVELDTLTDAVRPRAEDQYGWFVARDNLGLVVVTGVVVRRRGRKLGRAGIDRLVDRPHAESVPDVAHGGFGEVADLGDLPVGKAMPLGVPQSVGIKVGCLGNVIRDLVEQQQLV